MRRRGGISSVRAGVIALVVILVGCYLGFTKDIPFTKPFEIDAVFHSANSIRPGSPVRIAGVNVGKVKAVEAQGASDAAIVRMQIDKRGLPIHADATAKIRPRIFLEGNFFVDLTSGTPKAPKLEDGDTIKITQTAGPVQLDEVLTALQSDSRQDLRTVLDELAAALGDKPTAEQAAAADPSTRDLTGAQAFHDAYPYIGPAERSTAQVNQALLGIQPEADLRRLLRGLSAATEGLGRNEEQLKDLVTNFSRTLGAFASEQGALRRSVHDLGPTLRNANGALAKLNAAFPATRAFARELIPGVRETPATIAAGFPWIEQTRALLRPAELQGLARELSPAARDLAHWVDSSESLFPQANLLARCVADVILPTGDVVIEDEFTTGQPNYREFAYSLAGLAGEGQNMDGNGMYVSFQPGGGTTTISLGDPAAPGGPMFANAFPGVGTRPKKPSRKPPFNTSVPCHKNELPDLNGPWAAKGSAGKIVSGPAGTQPPVQPAAVRSAALAPLRPHLRSSGAGTGGKP